MNPPPSIQVEARSEGPDVRCGFCRDQFREDASHACPSCTTPYHLECWRDELRGHCATMGCTQEKPLQGPRRLRRLGTRLRRRYRRRLLDSSGSSPREVIGNVSLSLALASLVLLALGPWHVLAAWTCIALGAFVALWRVR